MGMEQPLTQKMEPQNFSRGADIAQGRRSGGSSFPSLCLAERPGWMPGIKVPPHTLKRSWDKIPDDNAVTY